VEAYNGFAKWLNFGGEGVIDTIDPVEQEKHLKYNHLVANAAAIQNVIDLTRACAICSQMATSYAARIWPSSVRTRHDD
jgi:Tn3 transposase DDE domain